MAGFELVLAPNKPPPDGASSFFLSSVGAEAAVVGFDPNNPPDPNTGFGRAGFSFSHTQLRKVSSSRDS